MLRRPGGTSIGIAVLSAPVKRLASGACARPVNGVEPSPLRSPSAVPVSAGGRAGEQRRGESDAEDASDDVRALRQRAAGATRASSGTRQSRAATTWRPPPQRARGNGGAARSGRDRDRSESSRAGASASPGERRDRRRARRRRRRRCRSPRAARTSSSRRCSTSAGSGWRARAPGTSSSCGCPSASSGTVVLVDDQAGQRADVRLLRRRRGAAAMAPTAISNAARRSGAARCVCAAPPRRRRRGALQVGCGARLTARIAEFGPPCDPP